MTQTQLFAPATPEPATHYCRFTHHTEQRPRSRCLACRRLTTTPYEGFSRS